MPSIRNDPPQAHKDAAEQGRKSLEHETDKHGAPKALVSGDVFCITNDGFSINDDEFCIKHDGFWCRKSKARGPDVGAVCECGYTGRGGEPPGGGTDGGRGEGPGVAASSERTGAD